MIRGVIWDVDGVLLDSMQIWEVAAARYLSTLGVKADADLAARLYVMNLTQAGDYIRKTYDLPQQREEIVAGIVDTVRCFYEEEVTLKPGAAGFLKGFAERGIPMAVATSSQRDYLEKAFSRLGIARYISGIYTCYDFNTSKNEPLIYQKAAESFPAPAEEVCVFEDAIHAIRTAKEAGFVTIGVYDEASAAFRQEAEALCDLFLPAFQDFDAFFDTVSHL